MTRLPGGFLGGRPHVIAWFQASAVTLMACALVFFGSSRGSKATAESCALVSKAADAAEFEDVDTIGTTAFMVNGDRSLAGGYIPPLAGLSKAVQKDLGEHLEIRRKVPALYFDPVSPMFFKESVCRYSRSRIRKGLADAPSPRRRRAVFASPCLCADRHSTSMRRLTASRRLPVWMQTIAR